VDIIVADSSPLIGLARIGQIALLQKLSPRVLVPSKVWSEVTEARADAPGADEVLAQRWIEVVACDEKESPTWRALVDDGEAEAIAVAKRIGAVLLVDDLRARKVALQSNVEIIGTLGILALAKKAGHIDKVGPAVKALERNGVFLSAALVHAVLTEVGE
jgi:uncharacterized protein